MAQEPKSQRTERPTGRRLRKARERGQVPRSREVPAAVGLLAFLVFGYALGPAWMIRLEELTATLIAQAGRIELTPGNLQAVLHTTAIATGMLLIVPLGLFSVAGVAGNLIQGPAPLTFKPLKPKFDKLNPINGLKKIFSLKKCVEVVKSVLKMALFSGVTYSAARSVVQSSTIGKFGVEGTFSLLVALTAKVFLYATALAFGLAVLDSLFQRHEHTRGLKMTKREVKDEHKQTEGDPMVRARIRQKQTALARSRMMADVPKATVVITNPEHVAVALRYVPGETLAPKLLAKGRAILAARIREIAQEHRVPIISDPPLARAIYRSVPIGAEIPPAFFRAVAEVLALVMPDRRGRRGRKWRPEESRP